MPARPGGCEGCPRNRDYSKVTTRAEKRKHEAAIKRSAELEAAAVEEQAKRAHGAARAAKRARIASRPVTKVFARDNCGRRV